MGDIADGMVEDTENGINRDQMIKYYIVWVGRVPGIYKSWFDCEKQIVKFKDARYKSFICDYTEAELILSEGHEKHIRAPKKEKTKTTDKTELSKKGYILDSLVVDAAWNTKTLQVEYQGVNAKTKKLIFKRGPFADGTNNIGEFLAIVHGLALLHKNSSTAPVYSDSMTAITWVRNKRANTNVTKTKNNGELFDLIARAEKWLQENKYTNQVLKWETNVWGENLADFGRK